MITIDLLRHGKVDGKPALYGHTDVASTAEGYQAVLTQAQSLQISGKLFTSPLIRCAKAAGQLRDNPIVCPDLAEMNFGVFDGVPFDDINIQDDWPLLESFWQSPGNSQLPGAESLQAFYQRVVRGWLNVVEQCEEGNNLVICHGGVIRMILAHVLEVDFANTKWFTVLKIDYASSTRIVMSGNNNEISTIEYINQVAQS